MSDLQDAIKRYEDYDAWFGDEAIVVDAARKVANLEQMANGSAGEVVGPANALNAVLDTGTSVEEMARIVLRAALGITEDTQ